MKFCHSNEKRTTFRKHSDSSDGDVKNTIQFFQDASSLGFCIAFDCPTELILCKNFIDMNEQLVGLSEPMMMNMSEVGETGYYEGRICTNIWIETYMTLTYDL